MLTDRLGHVIIFPPGTVISHNDSDFNQVHDYAWAIGGKQGVLPKSLLMNIVYLTMYALQTVEAGLIFSFLGLDALQVCLDRNYI